MRVSQTLHALQLSENNGSGIEYHQQNGRIQMILLKIKYQVRKQGKGKYDYKKVSFLVSTNTKNLYRRYHNYSDVCDYLQNQPISLKRTSKKSL